MKFYLYKKWGGGGVGGGKCFNNTEGGAGRKGSEVVLTQ